MKEKTTPSYRQFGETYKAMLLQAHPQSPLHKIASYQICKWVLKSEELNEYNKLDEVRCVSNKITYFFGPIAFISFMTVGFISNIYIAILTVLAGFIWLVASIKQNRAEKRLKHTADTARARFEKEWDSAMISAALLKEDEVRDP